VGTGVYDGAGVTRQTIAACCHGIWAIWKVLACSIVQMENENWTVRRVNTMCIPQCIRMQPFSNSSRKDFMAITQTVQELSQ